MLLKIYITVLYLGESTVYVPSNLEICPIYRLCNTFHEFMDCAAHSINQN